jgi:hypothetical protein
MYRCFAKRLRGKVERAIVCPPRHAPARPLTYLHVIIHYFLSASFDIFYCCFYLQGTSASQHRQEDFIEALNDVDQSQMA